MARRQMSRISLSTEAYPRVGDQTIRVGAGTVPTGPTLSSHGLTGLGNDRRSVGSGPTTASNAATRSRVRHAIGPIATPDRIEIVSGLPKTRSGKIMRRILRQVALGKFDQLGDITTLVDPSIVDELIANARKYKS